MDAEFPGVAERTDLLGLARRVLDLPVLHVALARRDLPVRPELDAVRRVEVDHLHLALERLLLGEARHDEQRVAEDHPVRPVLVPPVEVHLLVELGIAQPVEVVEERELRLLLPRLRRHAQVLDDDLRVDLLLDVDRHDRHGEVGAVLLVLALPDELRVERRVARIQHVLRCGFVRGDEIAQLLSRDVLARVLVLDRLDGRRPLGGASWRTAGHVRA